MRRGSSVDDYTAPEGDGSMQEHLLVYQRTGEPCSRCGRTIRRIVIGARATHFCSWCQRLSAADRKGAASILRDMTPRQGSAPGRRGRRWTELDGAEALGRTPADRRTTSAKGADEGQTTADVARARAERTRRAAARRRATARASAGSG